MNKRLFIFSFTALSIGGLTVSFAQEQAPPACPSEKSVSSFLIKWKKQGKPPTVQDDARHDWQILRPPPPKFEGAAFRMAKEKEVKSRRVCGYALETAETSEADEDKSSRSALLIASLPKSPSSR